MQNWHPPATIHEQSELTAGLIEEADKYRQGRDMPAIRVSAPIQEVVKQEPVVTLGMKRYAVAGGVTVALYGCIAAINTAAAAGAFAGVVTFAGYGLAGAVVLGVFRFVLFVRVDDVEKPKEGPKYREYYQEQKQGWREPV